MIGLKSENHISAIQGKSAKTEFSDGLQISMNIKDIAMPLIIHYYLLEAFDYTNLSTLNHNVRFLPVSAPGRWRYSQCDVRAKPCVHRFNYSGYSRREVPRQGYWT